MRQSDLGLKANPEPGRPKYLYAIIREDMRRRLCHAKSGDRLSTERQLALEFKVDLITVKRAMSDLESDGLVYRHQGRGTFATEKVALLKKILWVTGTDPADAHVSRYWSDCLRAATRSLGSLGYSLEQLWVAKDNQEFAKSGIGLIRLSDYIGFGFVGCGHDHPLQLKVIANSLPHVSFSTYSLASPSIINDDAQGLGLAISHLKSKGHKRVSVFTLGLRSPSFEQLSSSRFKIDFIENLGDRDPSKIERRSHAATMQIIAEGKFNGGVLITDDIVARGVTRAILESRGKVPANLCVVVVCERNAVVPFGLPVTYVISDVEAHVKAATRMLDDQINKIPLAERLIKIPFSIEKVADKDI